MAAWGPKSFQNELAKDYMLSLVNDYIHPIILEPIHRDTNFVKHKLAYHYDRFRAAIELMISFEENGYYSFAKGYYNLAIEKLLIIANDHEWLGSWDNESHSKTSNYLKDIDRQLIALRALEEKARI